MDLIEKARDLLSKNTITRTTGYSNKEERIIFTAPSPGTYNQQWFWDSCLHSLVWQKIDTDERAFDELKSLYIGKGERDLFPHMIFWDYKKTDLFWLIFDRLYPTNRYSELIQPPIIGYPLLKLLENGHEKIDELTQETFRYYKQLAECRDPEKSGLITIVHPWESGLDSSPKFDLELEDKKMLRIKQWSRMRNLLKEFHMYNWNQNQMALKSSFRVKCVLTNTLYLWGLSSFIEVLDKLKFKDEKQELEVIKQRALTGLLDKCWNEEDGLFYDIDMNRNFTHQIKISTISSLLPLMLDIPKNMKDQLIAHLTNKEEFWTKYPIPTVSMSERSFNPTDSSLLWRGPTWINTNYFIWLGLKKHKEDKFANLIATKTKVLVEKSGFREFYNPLTGEGAGAENFGWSTLAVLME